MKVPAALLGGTLLALGGCLPPAESPVPVHLRLVGSTSMAPLVTALAEEYRQRFSHISFEIRAVGSQAGLEALRNGDAEVALVSYPLGEDELAGLRARPMAWDGIAVAISGSVPLSSLTLEQLRQIFAGDLVDWRALGGPPGAIQVVSREEGSGTRRAFEAVVFAEGGRLTSTAILAPSSQAVADYLAQNPSAIAYLSLSLLPQGVKALAIEGIQPDPQSIVTQHYPLVRPFLLVWPRGAPRAVEDFVAWALSPAAQELIGRQYAPAR